MDTLTRLNILIARMTKELMSGQQTGRHTHAAGDTTQGGASWGSIAGTLSAQGDLMTSLNAKADDATTLSGYGITDAASSATLAAHTTSGTTHGCGTIQASATTLAGYGIYDAASSASLASHTTATGVHGAGTVASVAAATALITTHAGSTATHGAGTIAAKADITDANLVITATTAGNVTTSQHGFVVIAPSNTAQFFRGDATWATPTAGGGTPSGTVAAETTFGISKTAGVSTEYSRGDHTHGSPTSPGGGGPALVYKSATQAFTGTALANVTSLNFACSSTTLYYYRFMPMVKSGTITVGVKLSVTYPASTIAAGRVSQMVAATGVASEFVGQMSVSGTGVAGSSVVAANTISLAIVEGIVKSTAAGSIQLQAAAEAAGTVWIMDGSVGFLYTIA